MVRVLLIYVGCAIYIGKQTNYQKTVIRISTFSPSQVEHLVKVLKCLK